MMWYEIPGIPGYRINHRRDVMSLQGEWPIVLVSRDKIRLIKDGHYVTYRTQALWDLVSAGIPLQVSVHHETAREACDRGHEFTPENTMRRKTKNGDVRKCRRCHNDAVNRYRAKRRAEPRDCRPTN